MKQILFGKGLTSPSVWGMFLVTFVAGFAYDVQMRKAARIIAASSDIADGIDGLERGCLEILQGNSSRVPARRIK